MQPGISDRGIHVRSIYGSEYKFNDNMICAFGGTDDGGLVPALKLDRA